MSNTNEKLKKIFKEQKANGKEISLDELSKLIKEANEERSSFCETLANMLGFGFFIFFILPILCIAASFLWGMVVGYFS